MAVFLTNVCKFDDCGKIFPTLNELIIHIEDNHIDYDSNYTKEKDVQPESLPLSYILQYKSIYSTSTGADCTTELTKCDSTITASANQYEEVHAPQNVATVTHKEDIVQISHWDDTSLIDPNANYIRQEDDVTLTLLQSASKSHVKLPSRKSSSEKPFACPIPGCSKRYKNVNGIKYHTKNGHKYGGMDISLSQLKQHVCSCGKRYKSARSLKAHAQIHKGRMSAPELPTYSPDFHMPLYNSAPVTPQHPEAVFEKTVLPPVKIFENFQSPPYETMNRSFEPVNPNLAAAYYNYYKGVAYGGLARYGEYHYEGHGGYLYQ